MNNPQNPNLGSGPHQQSQPGNQQPNNQPQRPLKFTKGEITFHILIVVILMISAGIAFRVPTIVGAIATGISVVIIAFLSNELNTAIHHLIAKSASRKFDDFYDMLSHTPRRTRIATLFITLRMCLLSLVIARLIFIFASRPLVLSYCDAALNQFVKQGSETIGLSTGCIVFDTQRTDGTVKMQAAAMFIQGQIQDGIMTLDKDHSQDPSDAELLIDVANQQVLFAAHSHLTTMVNVVVATILTGKYAYMGRDELQAVAIAQHEFNQENKTIQLVVTIANMGNNQDNAASTANQIVNATSHSSSIIGVIGPPLCSQTKTLVDVFKAKNVGLPVISPDASCDDLTNYSPELYQIAPSNLIQAQVAAWYIQYVLHVQHVVIFTNRADTEGTFNQANDFMKQFPIQPVIETYRPGDVNKIVNGILDAEQLNPLPGAIYSQVFPTTSIAYWQIYRQQDLLHAYLSLDSTHFIAWEVMIKPTNTCE